MYKFTNLGASGFVVEHERGVGFQLLHERGLEGRPTHRQSVREKETVEWTLGDVDRLSVVHPLRPVDSVGGVVELDGEISNLGVGVERSTLKGEHPSVVVEVGNHKTLFGNRIGELSGFERVDVPHEVVTVVEQTPRSLGQETASDVDLAGVVVGELVHSRQGSEHAVFEDEVVLCLEERIVGRGFSFDLAILQEPCFLQFEDSFELVAGIGVGKGGFQESGERRAHPTVVTLVQQSLLVGGDKNVAPSLHRGYVRIPADRTAKIPEPIAHPLELKQATADLEEILLIQNYRHITPVCFSNVSTSCSWVRSSKRTRRRIFPRLSFISMSV